MASLGCLHTILELHRSISGKIGPVLYWFSKKKKYKLWIWVLLLILILFYEVAKVLEGESGAKFTQGTWRCLCWCMQSLVTWWWEPLSQEASDSPFFFCFPVTLLCTAPLFEENWKQFKMCVASDVDASVCVAKVWGRWQKIFCK